MKQPLPLPQLEFRWRLAAFILPPVLVLVAVGMLLLSSGVITSVTAKKQELMALKQTNADKAAFVQFISANSDNLESINRVVPNEAMMISVMQDFESVITQFDPAGVAEIASATPAKVGVHSAITLSIKLNAPLENLSPLLEQITQLPYMTQLLSSESNLAGESFRHQLNVRLYVQEPFNSP